MSVCIVCCAVMFSVPRGYFPRFVLFFLPNTGRPVGNMQTTELNRTPHKNNELTRGNFVSFFLCSFYYSFGCPLFFIESSGAYFSINVELKFMSSISRFSASYRRQTMMMTAKWPTRRLVFNCRPKGQALREVSNSLLESTSTMSDRPSALLHFR